MKKNTKQILTVMAVFGTVASIAYAQLACNYTASKPCGEDTYSSGPCDPSGNENPPGNWSVATTHFPDMDHCVYISLSTSGHRGCVNEAQITCYFNIHSVNCSGQISDIPGQFLATPSKENPNGEVCGI